MSARYMSLERTLPRTTARRQAFTNWLQAGYTFSQVAHGKLYVEGLGVGTVYQAGCKWTRLAAEKGHVMAQRNLGILFAEGLGVAQQLIEVHAWLNVSAAQGTVVGMARRHNPSLSVRPRERTRARL